MKGVNPCPQSYSQAVTNPRGKGQTPWYVGKGKGKGGEKGKGKGVEPYPHQVPGLGNPCWTCWNLHKMGKLKFGEAFHDFRTCPEDKKFKATQDAAREAARNFFQNHQPDPRLNPK